VVAGDPVEERRPEAAPGGIEEEVAAHRPAAAADRTASTRRPRPPGATSPGYPGRPAHGTARRAGGSGQGPWHRPALPGRPQRTARGDAPRRHRPTRTGSCPPPLPPARAGPGLRRPSPSGRPRTRTPPARTGPPAPRRPPGRPTPMTTPRPPAPPDPARRPAARPGTRRPLPDSAAPHSPRQYLPAPAGA
jgi:hypothetical protein